MSRRPRVLLAITVFNGADVVPTCLRSAATLRDETCDLSVLILDDASPLPGFSASIRELCTELGFGYYRSPRNLGIPRNVNLGLLWALHGGYDHVLIANSDLIFSEGVVDQFLAVLATDDKIGSVTAWSNNVSIYSLQNQAPERFLADQDSVNWLALTIRREFGDAAVDIPAGISFCICIPTAVLRVVGLMDPVYGRGYCEETDWSLRSKSLGYRVTLSPSAFVYHRGGGSTVAAGLIGEGHRTVPANELIVDFRYPLFRSQVDAYSLSEIPDLLAGNALRRIFREAAREQGYELTVGHARSPEAGAVMPLVCLEPHDGELRAIGLYRGFEADLAASGPAVVRWVIDGIGRDPEVIRVYDRRIAAQTPGLLPGDRGVVGEVVYPPRV